MSRGDSSAFDDEDDDRPRRRRDRDDFDDDRPRRRGPRNDVEDDYYGEDPRPPRRRANPGNGTGIGGLVCGIVGVVLAIGSGGSLFCAFCCFFLLPFSWLIAGVGAVLGAVAIILSVASRSQGNPTSLPV